MQCLAYVERKRPSTANRISANSCAVSCWAQIRSRRLIDLSGLVHNLNVVTVGVEYPGCVIVWMILELGRRYNFLPSACCNCSCKEGIHLRVAFGDKTE